MILPVKIYIMYVNDYPVGLIGLRLELNEEWKKWSGNFYYVIRESERGKGYGNKILALGLDEFRRMGYDVLYGQASSNNYKSCKVIENNCGKLIETINDINYYKIIL